MNARSSRPGNSAAEDTPPPAGHNMPPSPLEMLAELLTTTYAARLKEAEPIAAGANELPKVIENDDDAKKWGATYLEAKALFEVLDKARKDEKRPYSDLVDEHFKSTTDRLSRIMKAAQDVSNIWTRKQAEEARQRDIAERKRLADIAAENQRLADEAAAFGDTDAAAGHAATAEIAAEQVAAPAPKPTAAVKTELDGGGSAGARMIWKYELVDLEKIDLNKLRPYIRPDDVGKMVNKYLNQHKEHAKLDGVRFYQEADTVFRR